MWWYALAMMVVAAGFCVWWSYFDTYHLATVKEGVLYRCGNQGMREFETAVRKVRPRTVVLLIDDKELADLEKGQFAKELAYLKEKGIRAERIPVRLGGWPGTEEIRRFLAVVEAKENQPVLVHCAQGVRRTGMFVAAYQMSGMGWDVPTAKGAILGFGHSERTTKDVEMFIEKAYEANGRVGRGAGLADGKDEGGEWRMANGEWRMMNFE